MRNLSISWSISRANDSCGLSRVTVTDSLTSKRFAACGGGYDMVGTAFGSWLESAYQSSLVAFVREQFDNLQDAGYSAPNYRKLPEFYGLTVRPDGSVSLDGACGLDCMIRVAQALGLSVTQYGRKRRGQGWVRDGWMVLVPVNESAAAAA